VLKDRGGSEVCTWLVRCGGREAVRSDSECDLIALTSRDEAFRNGKVVGGIFEL